MLAMKEQATMNAFQPKAVGGFSLIELLVVLVILGLIAGLVVPNIMGRGEDAKSRTAVAEVQRLSMAVDEFYLDTGRAPRELRGVPVQRGGRHFLRDALARDKQHCTAVGVADARPAVQAGPAQEHSLPGHLRGHPGERGQSGAVVAKILIYLHVSRNPFNCLISHVLVEQVVVVAVKFKM